MKRLGLLLMWLGLAMGVVLSIAFLVNLKVGNIPLLVAIGLGKLSFIAAVGVMAAGAGLRRLGLRRESRERALADEREVVE
jgi:hypothetical protein